MPRWCIGWDVLCWLGHRRFARHWSVPQWRLALKDTHQIALSDDAIEHSIGLYQTMLAACQQAPDRLADAYRDIASLVLTIDGLQPEKAHSTQFSGKEYHRSSKASRREDLQVEEPVSCWDCSSFDFHHTLAGMLSAPLVGHEVVQMGQPAQKRLVAPFGVMEAFHRE